VRLLASERAKVLAKIGDGAVGAAIRDSALRAIGREDLVIESPYDTRRRGSQPPEPTDSVIVQPKLTAQQHRALDDAARKQDVSLSFLLYAAVMTACKLPIRKPHDQWYQLGKRRSSPPDANAKKAAAPKRRKKR
jgi:hypothetical protein